MMRATLAIAAILMLAACGVRETRDGPGRPIDVDDIEIPQPRAEPLARYGNHSPYTVNGRTYRVLPSARGYRERGHASWYGAKFHGRLTSSGEPFDMYRVSAAHKTLPLPTWVEVTNLENGRTLVVRVNDRGPFRDGRIIDLSYAAAIKLDVLDAGTAPVEVRALDLDPVARRSAIRPVSVPVEVQAGAFSERSLAREVAEQLDRAGIDDVRVQRARVGGKRVWRVRVGPFWEAAHAQAMVRRILDLDMESPVFVYP